MAVAGGQGGEGGASSFDPTSFGITWKMLTWTEDPAWTPPANGARVASTRDASGNGYHPAQATSTRQPGYLMADAHLGGRPSIRHGNLTRLVTPTWTAIAQPVSFVFIGYISTPFWDTAVTGAVAMDSTTLVGAPMFAATTNAPSLLGKMTWGTSTQVTGTRDMRPGVWVGVGGASGKLQRNGATNLSGNLGTTTIPGVCIGGLNNDLYPNYANHGAWGFVGMYEGDITAHSSWAAFLASAIAHYQLDTPRNLVVVDGDSRCRNYPYGATNPTPAQVWPAVLANTLNEPVLMPNFGIDGQTQASMNADATAQVDTLYSAGYSTNIAICAGGINDVAGGSSAATVQGRIQTYCEARRTAGFEVIASTMFACASLTAPEEIERIAVNTWLRANYATFADGLCDLDADARLSTTGDTTYFLADGVHLTAGGHAVVAELMATELAALGVT